MGPRQVNHLNNYIAQSILPTGSPYELTIESSILQWDSWSKPFSLHLKNSRLMHDGKPVLSWPELIVTANFSGIFSGSFEAEQLLLANPKLEIVRDAEGEFYIKGEDNERIALNALIKAGESAKKTRLPIHTILIYGADIDYEDQLNHLKLTFERSSLEWHSKKQRQTLKAQLPATMGMQHFDVSLEVTRNASQDQSTVSLGLKQINPSSICQLIDVCTDVPDVNMAMSGSVELLASADFDIHDIAVSLSGDNGQITYTPHFAETIAVDSLSLNAHYDRKADHTTVSSVKAKIGDMAISGSLDISKTEQGYSVTADAQQQGMPINDLYKYWPVNKAPQSRIWVTKSIRDGVATQGSISLRLKPEDIMADHISDDALKAEVKLSGATVHFLKDFPDAKNVSGTVHFTGTTIGADLDHAEMLKGTTLPKAHFNFSDLNHPNVPLAITLSVDSPAQDVLEFLSPPRFTFLASDMFNMQDVKGQATGDISLSFNTFSEAQPQGTPAHHGVNWKEVTYTIDAQLKDVGGVSLKKSQELEAGIGTFHADKEGVKLDLKGMMNNVPMQIVINDKSTGESEFQIKGQFDMEQLSAFGFPKRPELSGAVGADLLLKRKSGKEVFEADLDLTNAVIAIPDIKYSKPAGVKASLKVLPTYDAKQKLQDDLAVTYVSDALEFVGKLNIDLDKGSLVMAQLDRIRYGRNDVTMLYHTTPEAPLLSVKGKAFDYAMLATEGDAMTISDFPPLKLDMDVDSLYLPKDQVMQKVKGTINCGKVRCESANLAAAFAKGGDMTLKIYREGAARKFMLQSNNAGSLLQTFDITDRLFEGSLNISGDYDDNKQGNPLDGRLVLTDYVLKDAPILGRILNLSSLTGLVESLSGSGIRFDKMRADFVFVNDAASVKHAKATGPSLGLIGKGDINIKQSKIDIEGSMAPAYAINSVVSKIPLIGEALVGGEGEGVFAFSYSVKGNVNDPDVTVNPLSLLTPGFMRKFFDIFDAPESAKPALKAAERRDINAAPKPKEIMPPIVAPIAKPAIKPAN